MRKPIVVLYLPTDTYFGPELSPGELMAMFNDNHGEKKMQEMFYEYLWFVFVDQE